jgi:hypothetical protein
MRTESKPNRRKISVRSKVEHPFLTQSIWGFREGTLSGAPSQVPIARSRYRSDQSEQMGRPLTQVKVRPA